MRPASNPAAVRETDASESAAIATHIHAYLFREPVIPVPFYFPTVAKERARSSARALRLAKRRANREIHDEAVHRFAAPDLSQLPVQVLLRGLRIAIIIFYGLLALNCFCHMSKARPDEVETEEKDNAEGGGGRTEARATLAAASCALPCGAFEQVVNQERENRGEWQDGKIRQCIESR